MSKIRVVYDDDNYDGGAFELLNFKIIKDVPKDVELIENIAVAIFNEEDLTEFLNAPMNSLSDDDFRFVSSASMDGIYFEVSDQLLFYLNSTMRSDSKIFIYDPAVEISDKWNKLSYTITRDDE